MSEKELLDFSANMVNKILVMVFEVPGVTRCIDRANPDDWGDKLDAMRDVVADILRGVIRAGG